MVFFLKIPKNQSTIAIGNRQLQEYEEMKLKDK